MYRSLCLLNVRHILEKIMSMQHSFEEFSEKQRRVELKSVRNFVAKAVLVESANQFSLEDVCKTQYSLKYFSKPYRLSGKTLKTPDVYKQSINESVAMVGGVRHGEHIVCAMSPLPLGSNPSVSVYES